MPDSIPSDRHVRRSGSDYAFSYNTLLPQGIAWPRWSSVLQTAINGITEIYGFIDGRAADLLEIETDPRVTHEMLPEWETNFGLPDTCIPIPPEDEPSRRLNLVEKMTLLGAQSREFFIARGVKVGEAVTIREFAPYMCGVSRCGDTRSPLYGDDPAHFRWQLGPPENRFYWTVKINTLLSNYLGADFNCLLRRWRPAHTEVLFDYTIVGNDMLNFSEPIWNCSYIPLV